MDQERHVVPGSPSLSQFQGMHSSRARASSLFKCTQTLASVLLLSGWCWIWKVNCEYMRLPCKALTLTITQPKVLCWWETLKSFVLSSFEFFPHLFQQVLLWPLLGGSWEKGLLEASCMLTICALLCGTQVTVGKQLGPEICKPYLVVCKVLTSEP